VCAACHGPDGNMIADHKLANLRARRDVPSTIAYLKDPKPPMPRMYPDLLTERNLADVAAYLHDELH
jgi:alcohol dehydrogenase (cytochrome c)